VKLLICAPIPCPDAWTVAAELPPGYMVLRSLTIAPRSDTDVNRHGSDLVPRSDDLTKAGKASGSALVPAKDIEAPADDLQRLVRAYTQCDAGARAEVIAIAERLAGAAP
jgi:hypothetical protein